MDDLIPLVTGKTLTTQQTLNGWMSQSCVHLAIYDMLMAMYHKLQNCRLHKETQLHLDQLDQKYNDRALSCVVGNRTAITMTKNNIRVHKHLIKHIIQFLQVDMIQRHHEELEYVNHVLTTRDLDGYFTSTATLYWRQDYNGSNHNHNHNHNHNRLLPLTGIQEMYWVLPPSLHINCGEIHVKHRYPEYRAYHLHPELFDRTYDDPVPESDTHDNQIVPLQTIYGRIGDAESLDSQGESMKCISACNHPRVVEVDDWMDESNEVGEPKQLEGFNETENCQYLVGNLQYDQVCLMGLCRLCAERLFKMDLADLNRHRYLNGLAR